MSGELIKRSIVVSNLRVEEDLQRRPGSAVMVTGGAGFIGSHLVEALLAMGCKVRVIDNLSTGRREQVHPAVEFISADISRPETLEHLFDDIDCVFHAAALPRVPLSIANPLETHMVNVVGTINVLIAARNAGVRRVIFSGSSSVYGNQPELPLNEAMKPNPLSPYALQKLTGEQYTRLFHQLYGLETLTLRYFNVFGPRMATEGAYVTVMSAFLRQRRAGQPLTIEGDGEQTRDFTHVRDVVRANLLAMNCTTADGRMLNVGQGRSVSVNWVARQIGGPTVNHPARQGDVRHTLADSHQAEQILGWRPQVSTEDGLVELIKAAGL
jgi:nucleoside-diphosphate-sugar epimerase